MAYIQNFDKTPTPKTANPDLIELCIKAKQRHHRVDVSIVKYHKSPLLIEAHDSSTEAMKKLRKSFWGLSKNSGGVGETTKFITSVKKA